MKKNIFDQTGDKHTKREEIKQLLRTLEQTNPGLRGRIFGAVKRYPLEGWEGAQVSLRRNPAGR